MWREKRIALQILLPLFIWGYFYFRFWQHQMGIQAYNEGFFFNFEKADMFVQIALISLMRVMLTCSVWSQIVWSAPLSCYVTKGIINWFHKYFLNTDRIFQLNRIFRNCCGDARTERETYSITVAILKKTFRFNLLELNQTLKSRLNLDSLE